MGNITHEWNGTVLTVTSDSGTSSMDLKGEKGDTGVRGPQGIAGKTLDTSGILEMQYTDSITKATNHINIGVLDSIPFVCPIEAVVKQVSFPTEPGVNKFNQNVVSNGQMQEGSIDFTTTSSFNGVPAGQQAIFSFSVAGNVDSITNVTILCFAEEVYVLEEGNLIKQDSSNGRYYVELKGYDYRVTNIKMSIDLEDTDTYLYDCAVRYDGSTDYEEYGGTRTVVDLTQLEVYSEDGQQRERVNADGTVTGLYSTGEPIYFRLSDYSNLCTLTIYYKREVTAVIDELKQAIISLGGNV